MGKKLLCVAAGLLLVPGLMSQSATATHTSRFDIQVTADDREVAVVPYLYETSYDADAGWVGGDRWGYRCAFMFLRFNGVDVVKVTFNRIAGYAVITDRYMHEPKPQTGEPDDCPKAEPYKRLKGDPGRLPVIKMFDASDDHRIEVRDYANIDPAEGVAFKISSATKRRVTVIMYQDRRPIVAVYYDRLSTAVRLKPNGP
jgi:hypothetical protein